MSLRRWLFGERPQHRGLLLGLDCCGKTTLLYRLKLGRGAKIQTIPTIGFNVETIEHHSGCSLELWDVGGCAGFIQRIACHYLNDRTFALYLYDCSEPPARQDEGVELLREAVPLILEAKCPHLWIVMNKQDLLPKETREATVRKHREIFETMLKEYDGKVDWEVLDAPNMSALSGDGLTELIDDIVQRLGRAKPASRTDISKKVTGPPERTASEMIDNITRLNNEMVSAEEFWESFIKADLPSWDHHTHLRAGYAVLLKAMADGDTVLRCAETFLAHLGHLRSANPAKFKNTAHKTMTVFWLFQIRLAIVSFQADTNSSILPSPEDFGYVLLRSPQLMNSGLWKPYYTKDLLFTPEAREAWYPPNLQSLPAILTAAAAPSSSYKPGPPTVEPDRLLRFGFEVSRETMASTGRRSDIINQALEDLKTATIRLRASDPRVAPYSLTQAYFWVQLFHHAHKSVEEARATTLKDLPVAVSDLSFSVLSAAMGIQLDEWQVYYSRSVWESISARMEFRVPDLKPLPSTTVAVNAKAAEEMLKVEMDRASWGSEGISEKK